MITLIPWIGGKGKLLWIINELAPCQYKTFVDVFGGSGTVLMNRPLQKGCLEVYNDFNSNLTNLFFCVKYLPVEVIKELKFLPLHSRDDFTVLQEYFKGRDFYLEHLEGELALTEKYLSPPQAKVLKELMMTRVNLGDARRAANYFKLIRCSFSGTGRSFGAKPCNLENFFHTIWECSHRLADVVVENRDFQKLIRQYDRKSTFFYCDPPYFEAEGHYEVAFSETDHHRLHKVLRKAKGFVMVSYNNCEYVRNLYKEFYIFLTTRQDSLSQKEGKTYEELIITNYDPRRLGSQIGIWAADFMGSNYTLIHEPSWRYIKHWR